MKYQNYRQKNSDLSSGERSTNSGLYIKTDALTIKDVRSNIHQSIDFFKFLLQSDNELLALEMRKKIGGQSVWKPI